MADAPSPIAASALPAGFQSAEVAKGRDALRAAQTSAAARQVRTVDEADGAVETTDADARIFTDSEGTGSQGRSFEEPTQPAESPEKLVAGDQGLIQDDDGTWHLDVEA